ncbi:MAG: hypothetical protein COA90_01905 [Gammaproteobacteria bacterium]|nr:MAG: hypothetical protein COA90_01905 [Gammaproteobacteria bacterium]
MSLVLKPIQLAINTALQQDPETVEKLTQFEQRCIAISISDFDLTLNVLFVDQQITLSLEADHVADLTISGKALTLLKLGHDPESLFSNDIDINGDVQFAKQLQELLAGFDFDWEAQIAKLTGDSLAYPIAHGLRNALSWIKNTHQSLQLDVTEYLKEEVGILPDKSQITDYMADIDKLRADFDRLEARLNRL